MVGCKRAHAAAASGVMWGAAACPSRVLRSWSRCSVCFVLGVDVIVVLRSGGCLGVAPETKAAQQGGNACGAKTRGSKG